MLYMGIDPGKTGGIAGYVINPNDQKIERYIWGQMPTTERDLLNLLTYYKNSEGQNGIRACLEQVRTFPGEGAKGAFTFGEGYGRLKMALIATDIGYTLVRPAVWQSSLGVTKRKKTENKPQFKERLRGFAQHQHPKFGGWLLGLGVQRALCDALLIADYAYKTQWTGEERCTSTEQRS